MIKIILFIVLVLIAFRILIAILRACGVNVGINQTITIINGEIVEDTRNKKQKRKK